MARSHGAYIESKLFDSKAYKSLTKAQMRIYHEFMLKRRFGKVKKGRKPKKGGLIVNNGEITFTYAEAERLGYPRPTFQRALDKLIEVGLIDITYQGIGGIVLDNGKVRGEPTLFAISERWQDYKTNNFVKKKRKKDTRKGRGWTVYHERKQNGKK
jgi:hypothetical protein